MARKTMNGSRRIAAITAAMAATPIAVCWADIYRVDTGRLIPGTQGITPGPGVDLSNRSLEYANLQYSNLTNALFSNSDLKSGYFDQSNVTNASFLGTNLLSARFYLGTLTGADFTGAIVQDADFYSSNLTYSQLASTLSYQQKTLGRIELTSITAGWDFSGQMLAGTYLKGALGGLNFANATITGTGLYSSNAMTFDQITSTASYQQGNLSGVGLNDTSLVVGNLSGMNLTNIGLAHSDFRSMTIAGSAISGANFSSTTAALGVTFAQIESTASYQQKVLTHISLAGANLTNWDLSGQNLSNATFDGCDLTLANLTNATIQARAFTAPLFHFPSSPPQKVINKKTWPA